MSLEKPVRPGGCLICSTGDSQTSKLIQVNTVGVKRRTDTEERRGGGVGSAVFVLKDACQNDTEQGFMRDPGEAFV